jgi:hypothetical protein
MLEVLEGKKCAIPSSILSKSPTHILSDILIVVNDDDLFCD